MLPDNVLVEIFDFYRTDPSVHICNECRWWNTLTQVCRRWRSVIFESPRRLDLQIVCTEKTPTRTSLDIWPCFPIKLVGSLLCMVDEKAGQDNPAAALEHRDRISHIYLHGDYHSPLESLVAVMHEPFPVLRENLSCPPPTSSLLAFLPFRIPGLFRPR